MHLKPPEYMLRLLIRRLGWPQASSGDTAKLLLGRLDDLSVNFDH